MRYIQGKRISINKLMRERVIYMECAFHQNAMSKGLLLLLVLLFGGAFSVQAMAKDYTVAWDCTLTINAPPGIICAGASWTFQATATNIGAIISYQWILNGHDVGTNAPSYTASDFSDGDRILCTVISSGSCNMSAVVTSNTVTLHVSPAQPPAITIAEDAATVCQGSTATFTATVVDGNGGPVYQWQVNNLPAGTNSPVFASNALKNGDLVSCVYTDNGICIPSPPDRSNTIAVQVGPKVITSQVSVGYTPASICSGETVILTATAASAGSNPVYQWQVDGANVGTNNPVYTSNAFENGDVVTCRLSDLSACVVPSSGSVTLTVNPSPKVTTGQTIVITKGQSATLDLSPSGDIAGYLWSPVTNLSDPTAPDPSANPLTTTVYTLQVVSAAGCKDSGSVTVYVSSKLSIPNAFTPNGDGRNDIFYVIGGPYGSRIRDFAVFNRWGQRVFQVHDVAPDDPSFGWNGRIGGKDAPAGVYVYEVRVSLAGGEQQVFRGTVMLVR